MEQFELKETFTVKPSVIYNAWLDSDEHAEMTGGDASITSQEGTSYTAWDGYITGSNISLIPNQKIVQTWRTVEFMPDDEDSKLTIVLQEIEEGCELTLIHENIPTGQTQYEQGWVDNYFIPMKQFFASLA